MCFTTSACRLIINMDDIDRCIESSNTICWASHACQVMVPLVLCFKTMWSVPDTVSWGADYESCTDSSTLVWPHKSIDLGSISGFQHLTVTVRRCVDKTYTNLFFQKCLKQGPTWIELWFKAHRNTVWTSVRATVWAGLLLQSTRAEMLWWWLSKLKDLDICYYEFSINISQPRSFRC